MYPFQNKIKYFETRIVGLFFLSSSPLPVFPLSVCRPRSLKVIPDTQHHQPRKVT